MNKLIPAVLLATLVAGCSEEAAGPGGPGGDLLGPPPEGQGVQFTMVTELQPGDEVEHCKFVVADRDLWVNHDEVRFTRGSHHFLLYRTSYDAIPTADRDGNPVDTSRVFDCSVGPTALFDVDNVVGGSQNASGDSLVSFPPTVALKIEAGTVLLMNAHYINTSTEVLDPEVRINLWTIPEASVTDEGGLLFWYNLFIGVPEQATGQAKAGCAIDRDFTLVNAQSHMHKRGVGYTAWHVAGGAPEEIYAGTAWENVSMRTYPGGGLAVHAGDRLEYQCEYDNPEARTVFQGPRTTDEMCMLIGSYYPRDVGVEYCASDRADPGTQFLGFDWYGTGTATCAQTVLCFQGAQGADDAALCLAAASPDVAGPVSDVLRCFIQTPAGTDPQTACAAALDPCLQP